MAKKRKKNETLTLDQLTLPQLWKLKDCMENPEKHGIDPKHKGTPGQLAAVNKAITKLKLRNDQFVGKIHAMQKTGRGIRKAPKNSKKGNKSKR